MKGLVRRTVFAVVPPRVDYGLTPLGSTLLDTIQALVAVPRRDPQGADQAWCSFLSPAHSTWNEPGRSTRL
jgi:DNA-binding HxlR family transcriptional regulator